MASTGRKRCELSRSAAAQQQVAGYGDNCRSHEADEAHLICVHVPVVPMAPATPVLGAGNEWSQEHGAGKQSKESFQGFNLSGDGLAS